MTRKELRSAEREWTLVPMQSSAPRVAPAAQANPRYNRLSPWQSHIRKSQVRKSWRNVWGIFA